MIAFIQTSTNGKKGERKEGNWNNGMNIFNLKFNGLK